MSQELLELQGTLAKKYLGKQGVHAVSVDEAKHCVTVYLDPAANEETVMRKLRKDSAPLAVQAVRSPRARLA
ncbi:MAG: hypothetical protein SFV18_14595 [Bryobacteraceae bacterium]|jgi:hypothetical protein|nr:hypothetical protein [Bryobacteraceae bacterium]